MAIDRKDDTATVEAPKPESGRDGLLRMYQETIDRVAPLYEKADKAAAEDLERRKGDVAALRQRVESAPPPPPAPPMPAAPLAPKIEAKPFLNDVPGESWQQSLQKLMFGTGLIAQMAIGIKGGFPQGALAAYTGALQGWQEGDHIRAANEWKTYVGQLQQYDRDVSAIQTTFDNALKKYGHSQDRLKTEMGILAAEHGLSREAVEMAFKTPDRLMAQLNTQTKVMETMLKDADNVAFRNMMGLDRIRHEREVERHFKAMEDLKREGKEDKMKWAPVGGGYFDKETKEILPGVPEKKLRDNASRYKPLAHQDVSTLDFLKNTQPQINRLKILVQRLAAEQPGMNLFKAAELAGQGKLAVSPDLREAIALNRDLLVEMVRALGGSSVVRITLMKALERDVGFKPTDTVETGLRALETMERALDNRVAGLTGMPLKEFEPKSEKKAAPNALGFPSSWIK